MKLCSKCKQFKPLECFGKDKRSKSGLRSQCKQCEKIYEKTRDHNKQREYYKKYRQENRDKERARFQNWKENNPDKYKSYHTRTKLRNRCKALDPDKDITLEKLYTRDRGICAICGKTCDYSDYVLKDNIFIAGNRYPSIDHIKPLSKSGSHTWDNIQLVHKQCNSKKSNKTL